jgi:prevent-host-death family protein
MRETIANMHEAKTKLSQLVEKASRGETVYIARDGEPVVLLVPVHPRKRPAWGAFSGAIKLPDDFNRPLEEVADDFEGR